MRGLGVNNRWNTRDEVLNRAHLARISNSKPLDRSFTTDKVVNSPNFRLQRVCGLCGSSLWWWRERRIIRVDSDHIIDTGLGEWLCGRCHPNPNRVEG